MKDIETVKAAIRAVESDDNYDHQQLVGVDGEKYRKVGAYGFIESRWAELSDAAGYQYANWRDVNAQDRVATKKLQRDFDKYDSWEAAVVAFRYGVKAADAYVGSRRFKQRDEIDDYVRKVTGSEPDTERKVLGRMSDNPDGNDETLNRAQGIIRDKLVMMRDSQGGVKQDGGNEGLV